MHGLGHDGGGHGSHASRWPHTRLKKSRSVLSRFESLSTHRMPPPTEHAHGAHRQITPWLAHGPHADDPHVGPHGPLAGPHGPHAGAFGTRTSHGTSRVTSTGTHFVTHSVFITVTRVGTWRTTSSVTVLHVVTGTHFVTGVGTHFVTCTGTCFTFSTGT